MIIQIFINLFKNREILLQIQTQKILQILKKNNINSQLEKNFNFYLKTEPKTQKINFKLAKLIMIKIINKIIIMINFNKLMKNLQF